MAKRIFTVEEINDICETYKKEQKRTNLMKKYQCTDKVIVRVLTENNIEIKRLPRKMKVDLRKFQINDNYFNPNNQTHNSAYILGMLASDGCVASNQNQIYIELQRKDKEILEKINIELQNERPIKDYHNNCKDYENSKLYFFSQQIKQDLSLYNIIPNKTAFDNDFFQNIKPEYYMDYIRGHFDGDGSIKWTNGTINWQIDSTSLTTLNHMIVILQQYGIIAKILKHTEECKNRNRTKDLYRIYFYGKDNAIKLYKLFYQLPLEQALRMSRKQQHFNELLLKYKTHETSDLHNED